MTGIRVIQRPSRNLRIAGPLERDGLCRAIAGLLAHDGRARGSHAPAAALLDAGDESDHRFGPGEPSGPVKEAILHLARAARLSGTEGDAYSAMGGYASSLGIRIEWPRSATLRAAVALDDLLDAARSALAATGYGGPDPLGGRA